MATDKKTEAIKKAEDIAAIKAAINKKYGKGTLIHGCESSSLEIDRIPFGVYDLDMKIGGGVPRGRITMLKGRESCGKSTLALKATGNFQRCDRITGKPYLEKIGNEWVEVDFGGKGRDPDPMRVVLLDIEHSYTNSWSEKWGVDTDNILLSQPEYAEQGLDIADYLIRSRQLDLLVIDSMAAMSPGVEIEKSHEDWQIGLMARLLGKALRKWTSGMNSGGLLSETKCTIIIINQMRMAMGQGVSYWTTPGGNALGHFKSLDINLKKRDFVIDPISNRPVASIVDYIVDKNKTWATQGTGTFKLYFNNSEALGKTVGCTDEEEQIIKLASYWKILADRGRGRYEVNGLKLHGIDKVVEVFQNDIELTNTVKAQIEECERNWTEYGRGPKVIDEEATEA